MRKALFLVLLFFVSVMAPLASAATTETQFKGGATTYTKTFSGQGNGSAGVITFPYGSEVTSAQFNFLGEASTTTWSNLTDNRDFGGVGSSQWTNQQTGTFQYGTRTNLDVLNAEQLLLDARVALVQAERNQYVAAYNLLATTGRLTAKRLRIEAADISRN